MIKIVVSVIFIATMLSCGELNYENPVKTIGIYTGNYKKLMQAVLEEDTSKIEKIKNEYALNLNFAEAKYGVSLLNWCLISNKLKSFKKMLDLGANPNWQDEYKKFPAPTIESAKYENTYSFLQLSIKYGGNVNLRASYLTGPENQTPLLAAISSGSLKSVELLVDKGSNINEKSIQGYSPIAEALILEKMVIAKYLLINKNCDYKNVDFETIDGKHLNILNLLRNITFSLDSEEYAIKMELVSYLKTKGLDYRQAPIPFHIKESYSKDQSYLDKY